MKRVPSAKAVARNCIRTSLQQFPDDGYLHYHAARYVLLLRLLQDTYAPGLRVLDIGRSRFTDIVAGLLRARVDTLGFDADGETATGRHYQFDLNHVRDRNAWRTDMGPYDLVIFTEVIEHLYVPAVLVLGYINSLTTPGGHMLLQTPNAVSLHTRIQLLFGKTPYAEIRLDDRHPGHFREYTRQEIKRHAQDAGFAVERCMMCNYFDYRYLRHSTTFLEKRRSLGLVNHIYRCLPGSLQPGMTFVMRKTCEFTCDMLKMP